MATEDKSKKDKSTATAVIIAILVCLILWIGGMFLTHWYANHFFDVPSGNSKQALFGDSFGAVNALISACAFAGVIIALVLQRKDFRLQIKSLELQQKEFETQNKTLQLQRFENTFFNMLSLQQEIVSNLRFNSRPNRKCPKNVEGRILESREVFEAMFSESFIDDTPFNENNGGFIGVKEIIERFGSESYPKIKELSLFDHYFRHLYRIVKFVHESAFLDKTEIFQYMGMIRATLSRYELVWLFYNGLAFYKFKKLIEDYSMLQNINFDSLVNEGDANKYNPNAFGKQDD